MTYSRFSNVRDGKWRLAVGVVVTVVAGALFTRFNVPRMYAASGQATAAERSPGTRASSSVLNWTTFRWHGIDADGKRLERAALFVPVTIAGVPGEHAMQLDTGSHYNALHGGTVSDLAPAYAAGLGRSVSVAGKIAGVAVSSERFNVLPGYRAIFQRGQPAPVIGIVGLPFLESRVMIIDYPRGRLAVLDVGAQLPAAIEKVMTFEPLEYRNGKIYVSVAIDGVTQTGYFFDTGASMFPLSTTREEWQRLTGRTPDDPRNQRYRLPTWNDQWLEQIGAPMIGRLTIGPASREAPMVFFVNDERYRPDLLPDTRGLVGNALLTSEFAVLIDLSRRRIGFARSANLP